MHDYSHILVTLEYTSLQSLILVGLKVRKDALSDADAQLLYEAEYSPTSRSSKDFIHGLLPAHIRARGPVLKYQTIFDVVVVEEDQYPNITAAARPMSAVGSG